MVIEYSRSGAQYAFILNTAQTMDTALREWAHSLTPPGLHTMCHSNINTNHTSYNNN